MSDRRPNNLAARMGRWSAYHWKTATFGWLAFVIVVFALGAMAGTKSIDSNEPGPGESGRMERVLDEGFKQPVGENVLIQHDTLRATDPAFAAVIEDVVRRLETLGEVQNVRSPLDSENAGQISGSGRAALVAFEIRGNPDDAVDKIGPVLDRVDVAQQVHPEFFIGEFGNASAQDGIVTAYSDDLGKAGQLSLPITLAILVIAFGSLVAAGIPLLLALTAVFGTFGLVALSSHVLPMADEASALVLLIGLAVGVDYSMFYLKRAREERAAGRSACRSGSRRRHFRPLGARLGPDGHGGDGGHVPHRRQDLRVARDRDDRCGGHGRARLADRSAGPALQVRRQGRTAARAGPPSPAERRRARPVLGRHRRPSDAEARSLGRPLRRAAGRARHPCDPAAAANRGPGFVSAVSVRHADLQPHAGGLPGRGASRQRRG